MGDRRPGRHRGRRLPARARARVSSGTSGSAEDVTRRRRHGPRRRSAGPQVQGRGDLGRDRRGHDHPRVLDDQPRPRRTAYRTVVGERCFLMTYVHLAHDCHVGDGVIIANGTQLAGHVTIEDRAILSGLTAVHQFVTIGTLRLRRRLLPGRPGHPAVRQGGGQSDGAVRPQLVGLQRAGFPGETVAELKRAYRLFFNSELNLSQALERARSELPPLARGGAVPRVRRVLRAGRAGVSAAPADRRHRRRRARPPPRAAPGRRSPEAELVGVYDIDAARAAQVAGGARDHAPSPTRRAARPGRGGHHRRADAGARRGGAPGARARRAGADGEAARRDARRGGRADRARPQRGGVQLQVGHIERFNRALRAAEPYLDGAAVHRERAAGAVPAPRDRRRRRARPDDPRPRPGAAPDRRRRGHRGAGVRASRVLSPHLDIANARVEFANGAVALAHGVPGLARADAPAPDLPAQRLSLARPGERRRGVHAASGADWRPGTGQRSSPTSSSGSCWRRPRPTRSRSSSRASCTRCGASARSVVSGEEGRAALALALRVADAVRRRRSPSPARRMIARRGAPHLRLRRRALGRPPRRRRRPRAAAPAIPDADDRGARRAPHGGGRGHGPLSDGGTRRLRLGGGRDQARAPTAAAARAPGRFPGGTLRSRDPHRLSRLPRPRRRGGAAGGHQGALLHRAPALGLAAGPGPAVRRGGGPARGRAAVRAALLRTARARGASTWATRWWTGAPWPTRGEARARARHPGREPGAGHLPRQPARRRSRRLWAPFRDAALRLLARGPLRPRLVAGTADGEYPDPGPLAILRGDPMPGVRRGRCGAGQVGHHDARGGAGRLADGGGLQGAPADLAHVPAAPHRASG